MENTNGSVLCQYKVQYGIYRHKNQLFKGSAAVNSKVEPAVPSALQITRFQIRLLHLLQR